MAFMNKQNTIKKFSPTDFVYQSFSDQKGMDDSLLKLHSLKLPSLVSKSFLDIGCNEGFFCGAAAEGGANKIVGIDSSEMAIKKAKLRFPEIEFHAQDWGILPNEKFDVILFLSALHYLGSLESIKNFFFKISQALISDGVIVIETGLSLDPSISIETVFRDDGTTVFYPSFFELEKIFHSLNLGCRLVGYSSIYSDNRRRVVIHVKRLLTSIVFVTGSANSGKSTICNLISDVESQINLDDWTLNLGVHWPQIDHIIKSGIQPTREILYVNNIDPHDVYINLYEYINKKIGSNVPKNLYFVVGSIPFEAKKFLIDIFNRENIRTWSLDPTIEQIGGANDGLLATDGCFSYPISQDRLIGSINNISNRNNCLLVGLSVNEFGLQNNLKKVIVVAKKIYADTSIFKNTILDYEIFNEYFPSNFESSFSFKFTYSEGYCLEVVSVAALCCDYKVRFFAMMSNEES